MNRHGMSARITKPEPEPNNPNSYNIGGCVRVRPPALDIVAVNPDTHLSTHLPPQSDRASVDGRALDAAIEAGSRHSRRRSCQPFSRPSVNALLSGHTTRRDVPRPQGPYATETTVTRTTSVRNSRRRANSAMLPPPNTLEGEVMSPIGARWIHRREHSRVIRPPLLILDVTRPLLVRNSAHAS